jgi:GalNAc-alpha-(1->4)-GalNAc-alpha-(1->3)-diNAcBac-PP-undecaprenol alpha-1,4-N-acetyl-D-galactosaminyltransferase
MRITLVISTFGAGGAERVMAVMANYWAEQGHDLTLITLAPAGEDFYPLHAGICRLGLGLTTPSTTLREAMWSNVVRLKRLREAIHISRPDAVISFIEKTNILVLISTLGLRIPVVVCEHTDPRHHKIDRVWTLLRWVFYRQGAALVVLTEGLRGWAEQFVKANTVYVIPNPVSYVDLNSDEVPSKKRAGKNVMAMGRLGSEKGFDTLLQAFARCAEKHSEWSLIIIGEGVERSRLEALTQDLNMHNRITLVGQLQNPFQILRQADLFVLSSRYEGFPMALVEAMACQLPVVSTDCPSGPRDIIRHGVDGILVPPDDVTALANAMDRLMADPQERQRLGVRAAEVVERFSTDRIMKLWGNLLARIGEMSHA